MKYLKLTQGKFALVDNDDFDELNKYKWHFDGRYAARKPITGKIYLHKVILRVKSDKEVDHINRNKLDNRKVNLREATHKENNANIKLLKTNTSGFRGICWDKSRELWTVGLYINNKRKYLGRFKILSEAIVIYRENALEHFGNYFL